MAVRTARKPRPWRKPAEPSRSFPRSHAADVMRATGRRNLTAAAVPINLTDHKQLQKMRVIREGWQNEAFQYRHSVPEIRFSFDFLASAAKRMRIMPAGYQADGETDVPVPLSEIKDIPPSVALIANSALNQLGNGRLDLAGLMHKLSTNVSVAGECWLVGTENPAGGEDWKVRSVSEIIVKDDRYSLREVPQDSQGAITWIDLDPDATVLTRMWVPNPQWDLLADSPMRTLGETCEAIQILRRGIRASGRSRLSGAGVMVMPQEIEIMRPNDDNEDPQSDDVVGELMDAMATAIAEEGVASADIPIFLQGPGDFLDKIRLISFASGYDAEALEALNYLQGVIAVGVNLPKSVVTGAVEELNHWSAWSVSADTFRHYIEPHVITCCDLLTAGYFRQALIADGVPLEWVERLLLWYDPVELIAAPDKSAAAVQGYKDMTISGKAYRRETGFSEEDAPTIEELEARRVWDIRTLPANVLLELMHRADPTISVPAIDAPGVIPGIGPTGVYMDPPPPPAQIGPGAAPAPDATSSAPPSSSPPAEGPPPAPTGLDKTPPGITAAARAFAVDTDANGDPTGVMVALFLPDDLAQTLALPNGEPPDQLHLTLAFLGDASELPDADALQTAVSEWAANTKPISGEISGVGTFTAGPEPVTYLSADLPSLPEAREKLMEALANQPVSNKHGFTPHITLDYSDRAGEVKAGGESVTFESVAVVIGGERTDYPFAAATTASGARTPNARELRLSRKLTQIDKDLRARLRVAANLAMKQRLDRAGKRLKDAAHGKGSTVTGRNEEAIARLAGVVPDWMAGAKLGPQLTSQMGLNAEILIKGDWPTLHAQWNSWVAQANTAALATANQIQPASDEDNQTAQQQLSKGVDAGWAVFAASMTSLATKLLFEPDPAQQAAALESINLDTLVPTGLIRTALGAAGNVAQGTLSDAPSVGQIGTGTTISNLLTISGATTHSYTWEVGSPQQPFEPHQDLDGTDFTSFTSQALANPGDFPPVQYLFPGDHEGCGCDVQPNWISGDSGDSDEGDDDQ